VKAVHINVHGLKAVVEFEEGKSLETLQAAVGGYIECIHLKDYGVDMWVNEDGKNKRLQQNPIGTALWAEHYGLTDYTAGDIIITGKPDSEGYSTSLTDEQVDFFMQYEEGVLIAHVGERLFWLGMLEEIVQNDDNQD
jgi:hypothetical protein